MQVLQRISVGSAFKVGTAVYGLLAAVFGLLFVLVPGLFGASMLGVMMGEDGGTGAGAGVVTAIIMYIVIVVAYAVIGGVMSAIGAWAFNFVAGRWGGLEVQLAGPSVPAGLPQSQPGSIAEVERT